MVLVTGASGFVGGKIMQLCPDAVACPSLQNASEETVKRIVEESGADTIIHTAAISDIGECQAHPDDSYVANVQLPVFLARAAKHAKLICFSSDQVYSGAEHDGPYTEADARPANLYATHKWEMEQRVLDIHPQAVLLRAEWMYDYYTKKSNYFMHLLTAVEPLRFSKSQHRGVTYVKEVALNMERVKMLPGGVYNFGSETTKSMYDITAECLSLLGKTVPLEEAPPRHNLWMNCDKAKRYGVVFSTVEDGLQMCAEDYQLLK